MIFKSSKQLMAGSIAAALCVTAVSLDLMPIRNFYATSDQNEQYYIDGYHYEFFNMSQIGECSFEPDNKGGYSASWKGVEKSNFYKGYTFEDMPRSPESVVINYDMDFAPVIDTASPDGSACIEAYGFLMPQSQLYNIEYTIVDYQCNFKGDKFSQASDMQKLGSYDLDGFTYDLYSKKSAKNIFSLETGTAEYLSVRQNSGIGSGASVTLRRSIDVTKHIEEWNKLGMENSAVCSAVLDLCAMGSSGKAKLNSCDIAVTEKARETFSEDGCFYDVKQDNPASDYTMSPLDGGGFSASWEPLSTTTFKKRKSFNDSPVEFAKEDCIIADYDISCSAPGGDAFGASVHGWLDDSANDNWKDEFNIVLGRKNNDFPMNYKNIIDMQNVVELGTLKDNGITYRLYRSIPLHMYNMTGINEKPPYARYTYWSVPEKYELGSARVSNLSGSVDIKKHIEAYMDAAANVEKEDFLYEVSLDVSTAYLGSDSRGGSADVNKFDVFVGNDISRNSKVSFYCWSGDEDASYNMTPNSSGGFSSEWEEGDYKSFVKKLESTSEIKMDKFSVDFDADLEIVADNDTEWALCASCKSGQSNLEYYVFECYGENSVISTDGSDAVPYTFLKDHSVIKRSSATINGEKYDLFYLRYKVGNGGIGGYDIFRCVSIKRDAAVKKGDTIHLNGSIDWAKHIMVWDAVGFPTTSVDSIDSCEVFFETNSQKGAFSLNSCTFNVAAKEAPHDLFDILMGDLNSDGTVDMFDVIACRKAIIREDYTGYNAKAGDYNGNNKLDVADLIMLNRFVLGLADA